MFEAFDNVPETETQSIDSFLGTTPESSFNYTTLVPALTSLIGVAGTASDIDRKNDALMENLRNEAESLEFGQNQTAQQLSDLNQALGDKLSATGLEALKTESRLKAASAETGSTTTSEAQQTAQVNRLHTEAAILRSHDVRTANAQQSLIAQRLNFENVTEGAISGQTSTMSAFLQALNAGTAGVNSGLNFLGQSGKEDFFGTNTTGVA